MSERDFLLVTLGDIVEEFQYVLEALLLGKLVQEV